MIRMLIIAGLFFAASLHSAALADYRPRILRVSTTNDLDFGKIANLGGGQVTLSPDGDRTLFGRVENLGGAYQPASVEITGQPHEFFFVHAPALAKIRRPQGGALLVTNLISDPLLFGRLDGDGRATVTFGGRLLVGPREKTGRYRGDVTFWVVYL